jgi:GNAT superfamily N-acetyltransferase
MGCGVCLSDAHPPSVPAFREQKDQRASIYRIKRPRSGLRSDSERLRKSDLVRMTKQSGITEIRTSRWTEPFLPAGVDRLSNNAADEGHPFLFRLQDEWLSRAVCFKRPGECLFIAESEDKLVGIAGICRDPYQHADNVGRLRHVFVDTSVRSRGVARCLVSACLAQTARHFCIVRLSTLNPAAARLYEQLGFERFSVEGERATHVFRPT